jgi:RNA polymerase primary sigma factor
LPFAIFPVPPLPKLRIAALEELARQLRFAPAETLRRQLDRAVQFAAEIDPAINYPEEWIVFRITGYRPDGGDNGVIVGEALLGDVSALVERLSAAAAIRADALPAGKYLDADVVAARWSVSRKTLDRYRRQGLVALRVIGSNAKPRLAFPVEAVERFEKLQQERLGEAREFSRMPPGLQEEMLRAAAALGQQGLTLNQSAAQLAKEHGRGHETIRQLLKRHDAHAATPIFGERGPPGERERALIERAAFWAIDPGEIASRLKRSTSSVHRVINDRRAARLRALLEGKQPIGRNPDALKAGPECLQPAALSVGLGAPGATDLLELLHSMRAMQPPAAREEQARALAYQYLIARAAKAIAELPAHGAKATIVDAIETDLRWAARLKAELVRSQLPLIVRTLESMLKQPAEEMRWGELIGLVQESIASIASSVDEFHPSKGGRLASPAGFGITKVVTRFQRRQSGLPLRPRAASRLPGQVRVADWTRSICPWQSYRGHLWLEPAAAVREGVEHIEPRLQLLLRFRFGWGERPRVLAEVATELQTTLVKVAQLERRALRAAAGHRASGRSREGR